ANWLNDPDRYGIKPQGFLRQLNGTPLPSIHPPPKHLKHHNFYELTLGTLHDRITLSRLLGINGESLDLAVQDGVLKFFDQPTNGRCWSVVDKNHFVRQDRRLDGLSFVFPDGTTAKARTIGTPFWPIGIPRANEFIILCEGSSDFLAAYSLTYDESMECVLPPLPC
ncbi:MAG: hypothetical protein LBC30_03820, partial [Puniceicoccales bacterium]|nr:hypothetical protein [Puniceicoccales bacterium]